MFKNILVPFDLSSPSQNAFKVALDLAQKYDSKITLLTCIEKDTWRHYFYDSRADQKLFKQQKKVAEKYMEKLESSATKVGIDIKLQILKSTSVVKDITKFAQSKKMDLIVISSHGRTGFDKLMIGSVANGVLQRTNCPVLLIK